MAARAVYLSEVITSLNTTYKNLLASKQWDQMDSSQEQIIALTTQVEKLKKAAAKPQPHSSHNKGGVSPGANTSGKSGDKGDAKGSVSLIGAQPRVPTWQITKKGPKIQHPEHSYSMESRLPQAQPR